MTRYCRQRDKFRCGPIALLNTMKWVGLPNVTYQDVFRISKMCGCTPPWGTEPSKLTTAARQLFGTECVIRSGRVTYRQLKEHLSGGGVAILCYFDKQIKHGHSIFIYRVSDYFFWTVNLYVEKTTLCGNKSMREMMRRVGNYPKAILIRRRG